jgi:CubicO group peptidase (beta-lactamase class C family)
MTSPCGQFAAADRRGFLKTSSRAALGLSLLPFAGCAANPDATSVMDGPSWNAAIAALEQDVKRLMTSALVPGVSVVVIRDAAIAWRRAFGLRDAGTRTAVDHDTVFQAASMSKPVFAYAVMKLCERGVLSLDTPLTSYTPERFLSGDPNLELITARHILSHTSDLPNWRSPQEPLKTHSQPGSEYRYSGEGYYYLQSVVTRLTGRSDASECARFEADVEVCATDIDEYLRTNVLAPLGMASSGYLWNEAIERDGAWGHDRAGARLERVPPTRPAVARYAAAGNLLTTPSDYARFLISVIDPPEPDAFHLSRASIAEMVRPHVGVPGPDGAPSTSWALGWQVYPNGVIGHGGNNRGFHSHSLASLERRSGLVVMTNGDNGPELIRGLLQSQAVKQLV